ncbi:pre-mRNA splicing factor 38 [Chloropicon primus]|uniref:Pre-mRNA-splicing factor 38 n=2 Tax=Chloropicon primus TaxID=1764295 RepID=A0A5B8MMU2_9CHLO|nr:pre-mRNA splicing factor 38 [Chloropicon primus]UPR00938.1 pre-mRNA splicing factor 38 [Chloropicon primus]|eukprot:QDZ21717.1 pre-mRNA splicing factor 38 [Chloropicon primus]
MANRTDPLASIVHGTNPQNLIENIVRQRIYEQLYWKEDCFALTAETLLEKAVELRCVGGTHGGQRQATNFLCLVLKLLQLQPEKEIIYEYIANEDFKYVRVLGAFYLRLVGSPKEIYEYLEPLYHDFRKVRKVNLDGTFCAVHIDETVQEMLTGSFMFDTSLPRIPYRHTLVSVGRLKPRVSAMAKDFEAVRKELEEKKARLLEEEVRRREENLEIEKREAAERIAHTYRDRHSGSMRRRNDFGEDRRHGGFGDGEARARAREGKRQRSRRSPSPGVREGRGPKSTRRDREKTSNSEREAGTGDMRKEDLSIQETNALRAKLGLKPLKM